MKDLQNTNEPSLLVASKLQEDAIQLILELLKEREDLRVQLRDCYDRIHILESKLDAEIEKQ